MAPSEILPIDCSPLRSACCGRLLLFCAGGSEAVAPRLVTESNFSPVRLVSPVPLWHNLPDPDTGRPLTSGLLADHARFWLSRMLMPVHRCRQPATPGDQPLLVNAESRELPQ